jgi:hypothetical protein
MKALLVDRESREQFAMPAQHLFKDLSELAAGVDLIDCPLAFANRRGARQGM